MIKKYPAILALLIQMVSGVLVYFIFSFFKLGPITAIIMQGTLAAAISIMLKQSRWWVLINFIFVPLIFAFNNFDLPPWAFLLAFAILLLINWNSFRDRVPLYLTGDQTIQEISELLKKQKKERFDFIDLGSGLAGTLHELSKKFPESNFHGVETAPLVFIASWFRCLLRKNCHIRFQSIWKADLSKFDVVYCFLSPVPMPGIWEKAKVEMKKGSLLISNTFEIPGVKPTQKIELNDWRDSRILVWKT